MGLEYKEEEFFENCQLKEEYENNKEEKRYNFRYRYELLPGRRYLVISKEYIALLKKYMATLHSRGSYALKGIIVTSTTIDPNYRGFIYASLMNCSKEPVYIREHDLFVTMVIHTFVTKTNETLSKTETGMPMDVEQTLNGRFSNVCEKAAMMAKTYRTDAWKKIELEFGDKYATFQRNSSIKICLMGWISKAGRFFSENGKKKEFWIGVSIVAILVYNFIKKGIGALFTILEEFINKIL